MSALDFVSFRAAGDFVYEFLSARTLDTTVPPY